MREQLPAPEFNTQQYERPHLKWICGRAAEGAPCRNGAGPNGSCGADFECSPALDKKAGEPKGHFRCTRARDSGGPCADGPRPDAVGLRDGDCLDRGWIQRHAPVLRAIPRAHRLLVVNAWRVSNSTK